MESQLSPPFDLEENLVVVRPPRVVWHPISIKPRALTTTQAEL